MKKWIAIVAAVLTCGCLSWFVLEVRATPQDELPLQDAPVEAPEPRTIGPDFPPVENEVGTEFTPSEEFGKPSSLSQGSLLPPNRPSPIPENPTDFPAPALEDRKFIPIDGAAVDRAVQRDFDRQRFGQSTPLRDANQNFDDFRLDEPRPIQSNSSPPPADPRAVALGKIRYLKKQLATGGGDHDKLEDLLKSALNDYFQADMQRREAELDAIRKRLAAMEAKLKKRSDSQKKIVDLQLTLLLHEADGLGFFAPGHGPNSNTQSFRDYPEDFVPRTDHGVFDRQPRLPSDDRRFPDDNRPPAPIDNPRPLLDNPVPQRVPSDPEPLHRDDLGFSSS